MLVYEALKLVRGLFDLFFGLAQKMFPTLWTAISSGFGILNTNDGWRWGLLLLDKILGINFLFYAINTFFTILITIALVNFFRNVLGLISNRPIQM
jgi:hypothetical protein